jgi:hypothetical protein
MTERFEQPSEGDDYFLEFDKFEDIPADYHKRRCLKDTMFANFYDPETVLSQLTKCLKVLPHDQNTSGFFITIIRKIKEFAEEKSEEKPEEEEKQPSEKPLPLVI